MKRHLIILSAISLVLLFSGCNNNQPSTQEEVIALETNFSLPSEYSNEYKIIEGTEFDTQTSIVSEDRFYTYLTYKNTSEIHEEIQFQNIVKPNADTLSSYLINTLPNRDLRPEMKEDYLAELKLEGWQNIITQQREIWIQGLTSNLQGYESYGWILNKKTNEVLPVIWALVDDKNFDPAVDQDYAQRQYDKFIEIIKKVQF